MQESPDLLTEEDYNLLNGFGPTGTQLDFSQEYDSDETVDETEDLPLGHIRLVGSCRFAIVDPEDAVAVGRFTWTLNGLGYAQEMGSPRLLHHLIMGRPGRGLSLDHINNDKLDNRRSNLRVVSYSANARNKNRKKGSIKGKHESKHRSKFPGVSTQGGRYNTRISIDGKQRHIGSFGDENLAAFVFAVETIRLDPVIWYQEWNDINLDLI